MTVVNPQVRNVRDFGKYTNETQVYVGRRSKWGNPFRIGVHGTREEVIEKYRSWLQDAVYQNLGMDKPVRLLDVIEEELRGKELVCWCAPLPCHADILLELANR